MALSDYLAKHYLNASTPAASDPSDTRPTKKRKKNKQSTTEASGSLLIADDDADLLLSSRNNALQGDDENDTPTYFDTKVRSAEFRKSKKNAWQSLSTKPTTTSDRGNEPSQNQGTNEKEEEDEADTLLRQQIASTTQSRLDQEAEDAPAIVDLPPTSKTQRASSPRMSSGVRPGLQTAEDTARLLAEEEEAARLESIRSKANSSSKSKKSKEKASEEETIYRDATGRRIDLSLRRAEAQAAEKARLAAEKAARESAMGEVQLRQKQERSQALEDAKFLTLGRSVEDEEYNDSLKERVHWDDPMVAYLAKRRQEEGGGDIGGVKTKGRGMEGGEVARKARREYNGAAPPNRYGIKPGWRWDGVDRGNGFEKEWFQARGRKARTENLEYQWQMDE